MVGQPCELWSLVRLLCKQAKDLADCERGHLEAGRAAFNGTEVQNNKGWTALATLWCTTWHN